VRIHAKPVQGGSTGGLQHKMLAAPLQLIMKLHPDERQWRRKGHPL
jgi:hypothetical protein